MPLIKSIFYYYFTSFSEGAQICLIIGKALSQNELFINDTTGGKPILGTLLISPPKTKSKKIN